MISIGEKVETIVCSRSSGEFGLYLGSSPQTFGAAHVDGMTFKVGSRVEIDGFDVLHVESGLKERAVDRFEMAIAIDALVKRITQICPESLPCH